MFRNIALVLLGVLFAAELKNSYDDDDDKVKVYLLLTQTGEENTTLQPIAMPSNIPENISLKDLLSYVPDNYKTNIPRLGTASVTGVSANDHNYSRNKETQFENMSDTARKHLHQFTNKSNHLSYNGDETNRRNSERVILRKIRRNTSIKDKKVLIQSSKQKLNNHLVIINNQTTNNENLSEALGSENDTREESEGNHVSSYASQRVILKKLYSKRSMNTNKITDHSSHHQLSNDNETIMNKRNITKPLLGATVSGNFTKEKYGNHDIMDVYYVVHTCSQKKCQIHQVVVLKRGTVQEEDMKAILQTINESQYSSNNNNGWLYGRQMSYCEIINGMLHSHIRNTQWLPTAIFSVFLALLTKLICGIYTYKKKVDMTYLFMEESISDMKEMADILKNYTAAQLILERRILLACSSETDNETHIKILKNEIAHLKIKIRSLDGCNTINMDDFVTAVLNYLQNCLESGTESTTDEVQPWHGNVMSYLNDCEQLI